MLNCKGEDGTFPDDMQKQVSTNTQMVHFPFIKTPEQFDFSFRPSIDHKNALELASCCCIERVENIILLGPPAKTHLAVALVIKAIQRGYRILFSSAIGLMASLTRAYAENRLEEWLKLHTAPWILIIDKISHVSVDSHGAHLLFQHISQRYEREASSSSATEALVSGGHLWRPSHRHLHLGPPPPPQLHHQHQGGILLP